MMAMLRMTKASVLLLLLVMAISKPLCTAGQQSPIVLDQGAIVGLKVFPDSSRTAVYAFLGIPYAQPPSGELRFAPPRPHMGWNWTLQAMSMKPICPQLANTIYDETPDGKTPRPPSMSEDCLYLNVWVPEAGMRYGNLPVVVLVTGEEMSYDWPRNRASGLDFASDGVVVVSVQYRTNIFGWISMGDGDLSGNYGLMDLELALQWIQRNIRSFGGRANEITLLGHGTSGAACALALVGRNLKAAASPPLTIGKLILMSPGNIDTTLTSGEQVLRTSRVLIQKLGCHFEELGRQMVECLRMRSVSDLLKSFESVYHSNSTFAIGPVLTKDLRQLLPSARLPPTLMGLNSNEGAFVREFWLDLAREGYPAIRGYINSTVLPGILRQLAIDADGSQQVAEALNWRYFNGNSLTSAPHLLNSLQRLISEAFFEAPFYRLLQWTSANEEREGGGNAERPSVYAYVFDSATSMDMRGKVNLFGGATHSADLPLLLGPGMFQQISRRRFTADEDKLCRKMRAAFVAFVKEGNPTPGRIFDAWLPFTADRQFIYNLGDAIKKAQPNERNDASLSSSFETNLPQIEKLLKNTDKRGKAMSGAVPDGGRSNRNDYSNPYQLATGNKAPSYLSNQQDSGYAQHLRAVYGFWHVLLPRMASIDGAADGGDSLGPASNQRSRLLEAAADASRYRRGFFVMLGLVCVLLGILGLCVYLLQRDPLAVHGHSSRFCL